MTNVLIIEDDPMVAMLNQQFMEQQPQTTIIGNVRHVVDARNILKTYHVDLILLDVYLPGITGIDFLSELHHSKQTIPVIMITAANDIPTVKDAIHYGVIDYLIKPFTFERFTLAFSKYLELSRVLSNHDTTTQTHLDTYFTRQITHSNTKKTTLPKGLSKLTLKKVVSQIDLETEPFSTDILAKKIALSRISTKKYLVFLAEIDYISEEMEYREVGRPITLYDKKKITDCKIHSFI
ncbi:MAG: response regulator [Vagococcus sp.]